MNQINWRRVFTRIGVLLAVIVIIALIGVLCQ